ncbi:MAG: YadA-like family protein, partial [Selenomonadaceae bacterium]|nr:YadA-like family protein [Selenomonadaceae bacterium]
LTIQSSTDGTTTTGPSVTKDGIDAGGKAITNIGSVVQDGKYTDDQKNNAATLGDVSDIVKAEVKDVNTDLTDVKSGLDKKANINASNIGSNLKNADGTADATDEEKLANENAWGIAIGTGKVADPTQSDTNGSKQLVTGGTVYTAIHDTLNGGIDNVVFGHDGKNGQPGKDGSIGLVGPKGQDGKDGKTTTIIKTETGAAGVNGTDGEDGITRIVYNDKDKPNDKHTVATLDDGMKYVGDTGDVANVKLDHQLKLSGTTFGADKAHKSYDDKDWTSDNIAVVSSKVGNDGNAVMNLKLAKDLKNLNSSTYTTTETAGTGDQQKSTTYTTTIDSKGLTIQSSTDGTTTNGPSVTKDGINAGGKAIANVGSILKDGTYDANTQKGYAATLGDVDSMVQNSIKDKADKSYVDTELGKKADKSYVDTELGKKADKTYVDDQLKTKADADNVYTKNETYTKTEVDTKVTSIQNGLEDKAQKDLSNISNAGKQVIKDTMKEDMDKKANVDASNIDTSTWAERLGTGKVASGDKNLVTGDTVNAAISGIKGSSLVQSDGKTLTIGSKDTATKVDISGQDAKGNKTGRVITGVVSDASDPNSAANVGYVNGITSASNEQIYRDMNMQYNRVENDISRATAGSNALAALHPMQEFDPDDKAQFAVGYGHYRNSNAGAVGAFYQPDENSMVNFGVSFGNGDAGINAGVTFKFGPGGSGHHALTKTQMAKVINTQAKEIEALKQDNADKDKRIDALEQKMAEILARLDKSQAGA